MNDDQIRKMIGKIGLSKIQANQDWDGDGVKNILDCNPTDPRKQGILHKLRGKFSGRTEEEVIADDAEIREVRKEEKKKQRLETATYREKLAGEKRRAYIKGGGFFGSMERGLGNLSYNVSPPPKTRKKKKKTGTRKRRPSRPISYTFNMPKMKF